MKRKYIFGVFLSLLVLVAVLYLNRPGRAPSGQTPLQYLTAQNVADFKQAFNAAKDDVRVLLLLSPT